MRSKRFSISKLIPDPAAAHLGDDSSEAFLSCLQADMSMSTSMGASAGPAPSSRRRSGTRRSSLNDSVKRGPIRRQSTLDSLDDLERFADALQKTNPEALAQAITDGTPGKKKKNKKKTHAPSS